MSDSGHVIGETNPWHPNYLGGEAGLLRELEKLNDVIDYAGDLLGGGAACDPPAHVTGHGLVRALLGHMDVFYDMGEELARLRAAQAGCPHDEDAAKRMVAEGGPALDGD